MTSAPLPARLRVRTISGSQHLDFIRSRPSVSFLQTPAWAVVKSEWRGESIGWFDGDRIVGAALVLYRKVPRLKRYLAYLPEGPDIDWLGGDLERWLDPLRVHLKDQGAFGIRMGPPVVTRRWHAGTIKQAIADPVLATLSDVPADVNDDTALAVATSLTRLGWKELPTEGGFSAGQPKFNFQVPLAGRTEEDVLAGMNQLWRRNIKKAAKAGVEVEAGTRDDLAEFHRVYAETAERDHFTPRPLSYFERMWDALTAEEPDRLVLYLARHEGDLVAATTMVRVGEHAWYSYGASTTAKRDVRGSNAIQWQMMRDALAAGATTYDMRGITETLDPADSHVGLIQFKVGTGGEAVEYLGEWDLPINRALHLGFTAYMRRRG
ncbi:lipid II:glycine glycyltransferase FemX [Aeromicrobium chenweiae]|uniref:Peptidoglycan bridge formation protein FemAB n=1 Tax=Aeromicrobium chenweiae TaxID=2079793 RepID=A0A2S0WRE7_9ACTN|nr:peptidoglycan bridge formation glycyltransferase FemA/FemB family protein [Aeromicrobium chenweiae]AWB93935.1 peptidoglycan bridge formation protein FemAB [Aeromicrobium chenweiae]TGN30982.1 peptidoglycan bridge formation glycyltransferase FemA/FemB family protein [Aeromicrobium chenweiae]